MKAREFGYWTTTALLTAEMLTGGVIDLARLQAVAVIVSRLGYPLYMLTILGIWKLLAVLALLAPRRYGRIKEWAYAGIFFDLTGAAASHAACGDWTGVIAPLAFAGLAVVSWALRPQKDFSGAMPREETEP